MDRFSGVPIPDPQSMPITGECDNCGCELYDNEVYCEECLVNKIWGDEDV